MPQVSKKWRRRAFFIVKGAYHWTKTIPTYHLKLCIYWRPTLCKLFSSNLVECHLCFLRIPFPAVPWTRLVLNLGRRVSWHLETLRSSCLDRKLGLLHASINGPKVHEIDIGNMPGLQFPCWNIRRTRIACKKYFPN